MKLFSTNHPFYGHYTGQPALHGTSSKELEDFVGAKFYCLHALAGSNQRIRVREKTLEFSSTVLSTLFLYNRWYRVSSTPRRQNWFN